MCNEGNSKMASSKHILLSKKIEKEKKKQSSFSLSMNKSILRVVLIKLNTLNL